MVDGLDLLKELPPAPNPVEEVIDGYRKKADWKMMQEEQPDDYVIATGETYSVRDFLEEAFGYVGLQWQNHVEIDSRYFRPTEVDLLQGDASKARARLNWTPKVTFRELVRLMVDADLAAASQ